MHITALYFLAAVVIGVLNLSSSVSFEFERELHVKLFRDYNKFIRPVHYSEDTVEVTVEFYLGNIHSLDEKKQVLKCNGYFVVKWKDEFLSWKEADYGGVDEITVSAENIWIPDLELYNSANDGKRFNAKSLTALVNSDGVVTLWPSKELVITCNMDIQKYPFDSQECVIELGKAYASDAKECLKSNDQISLDAYEENGEWQVIETYQNYSTFTTDDISFTSLIFGLKLQRKYEFYISNTIFPVLILSLLSVFGFLTPITSGEKMGFCVAIFLTFAVFMTLITDSLPHTSQNVCLFSLYLSTQMALSGLTIILNIVILRIYNKGEDEVSVLCRKNQISPETDGAQSKSWIDIANSMEVVCFFVFLAINILVNILFISVLVT